MKKYFQIKYLYLNITIFMMTAQKAFCLTDVLSSDLESSLKSTSAEPSFISIAFALLFVILLIYITGIIYQKLNLVGAKTVKEQLKNYDLTKAVVLSTTQLGQGKNLHVIELNNNRYLIGATADSITLIKELGSSAEPENADVTEEIKNAEEEQGQEQEQENEPQVEPDVIIEPVVEEETPELDIDKAIRMLYNKTQEEEIIEEPEEDAFDIHKKYL